VAVGKPPLLKPPTWESGRAARELAYVVVLLEEAHVSPTEIPKGQVIYAMASPYERAGLTSRDIERWIADCDPKDKPARDPVDCVRERARAALRPKPGLAGALAVIGGIAFLASFSLSKWWK